MRKWVVWALAAIFLGSIIILFLFFGDAEQNTLHYDAGQALLQIGVIAAAGAVISLLVFEYQHERQAIDKNEDRAHQQFEKERDLERQQFEKQQDLERQQFEKQRDLERQQIDKQRDIERMRLEYRETLLLSTLSNVMKAYSEVKKARRLMRGRGIETRDQVRVVRADQYDICFDTINDAQLDLENLVRDVKTSAKAFSEPDAIVNNLESMEKYLGKIIGEYEKKRRHFSDDEPSLPLTELERLEDFIQPADESKFEVKVITPNREVQSAIRGDLLHPNLPEVNAAANS